MLPRPEAAHADDVTASQNDLRTGWDPAEPTLDADNLDFGSGGPVGLPFGTRADPAMLIQAGKDGRVFSLNRDSLGGREQGPGGTGRVAAEAGPHAGQWGSPCSVRPGLYCQRQQHSRLRLLRRERGCDALPAIRRERVRRSHGD